MRNFQIDDLVLLIHTQGIHDLEINTAYKIVKIEYNDNKQFIALEGTGTMTDYSPPYPNKLEYHLYNSERFKIAIRIIRKNKLTKIWK